MIVTNNTGLPEAIVEAVKNDSYSKGDADYSVTGLLKPGYMVSLQSQYEIELVEDASDRIFSLFGQLIHSLFERADLENVKVEQRFYSEFIIDGMVKKISGQVDVIDGKTIQDYKFTTLYKLLDLSDFTAQLNMYRFLCHENGIEIDKLQVVLIFRDWYKSKTKFDKNYPQQQVKVVDLPVWTIEETRSFIADKIRDLIYKKACTDAERWVSGGKFAVMCKGKKRAVKLHDSKESAESHALTNDKYYVEERPKVFKRCDDYCNVSKYCKLYNKGE